MKVLSLFDGMACGVLALRGAEIEIESYDAFEIDKYAIQTSSHNFPFIKHHGDVFEADFTKFEGVDLVCGGSPCTYWSIAQKNNRETEASGLGWELFQQYVRAIKETKPKFFIYENNRSMSKAIRQSIDETFGFEAVFINSALVSAQNRQRLYWVGRRNEDGTYSKVNVEQPKDRGIVLRDILETGVNLTSNEKSYALTTRCNGAIPEDTISRRRHTMVAEPINTTDDGKSQTLKAQYHKNNVSNFCCYSSTYGATGVAEPVRIPNYGADDKSRPVTFSYAQQGPGQVEKNCFPSNPCKQRYDYIAEPIEPMRVSEATKQGYVDIEPGDCVDLAFPSSKTRRGRSMKEKSNCLMANSSDLYQYCGTIDKPIYEVKDGFITIKNKKYPIKLKDGFYIIRKLTVRECMRLQTVPEWYEFPVSNSQAYKLLGNGWTISVIEHLLRSCLSDKGDAQPTSEQMKFF